MYLDYLNQVAKNPTLTSKEVETEYSVVAKHYDSNHSKGGGGYPEYTTEIMKKICRYRLIFLKPVAEQV